MRDAGRMSLVRVGDLSLGQVISSEPDGLAPAVIVAMTSAGDRQLQLIDIATGERIDQIYSVVPDRTVTLHDIEVGHHVYTNITQDPREVSLGPDTVTVEPGGSFHHTGPPARPDVFAPDAWSHRRA